MDNIGPIILVPTPIKGQNFHKKKITVYNKNGSYDFVQTLKILILVSVLGQVSKRIILV